MSSAGGQVPTQTRGAGLGQRLGDREAEAAVIGDAGDERPLAGEIDGEHGFPEKGPGKLSETPGGGRPYLPRQPSRYERRSVERKSAGPRWE